MYIKPNLFFFLAIWAVFFKTINNKNINARNINKIMINVLLALKLQFILLTDI